GPALAIGECTWGGAAVDEKQRSTSERNGQFTADVATARSARYWCLSISMELQPIFLCGPVLLLHRRTSFQRAVRRHVDFVARRRPAGGQGSLRRCLPLNPAWLPNSRLGCCSAFCHHLVFGLPRVCERDTD